MKRRVCSVLLVGAAAAAIGITGALPAAASSGGGCTSITNGSVCTNPDPTGYQSKYAKTAGDPIVADFNLVNSAGDYYGDDGSFGIEAGKEKTYVFAVGNQGCRRTKLKDLTHSSYFYGPYYCY